MIALFCDLQVGRCCVEIHKSYRTVQKVSNLREKATWSTSGMFGDDSWHRRLILPSYICT